MKKQLILIFLFGFYHICNAQIKSNNAALRDTNSSFKGTASNPTPTLEELNQRVSTLETLVTSLDNEVSFQGVTFAEVIANNDNLFESGFQKKFANYVLLKIDNPLSNNNPSARIFYSPQTRDIGGLVNITYNAPFWYAQFSSIAQENLAPYDILNVSNMSSDFYALKERDFSNPASFNSAIQISSRRYLQPGQNFLFVIFIPQLPKIIPHPHPILNNLVKQPPKL